MATPREAVLVIAHGSRRDEANSDLVRVASSLRDTRLFDVVELAYLELAKPDIPEGAAACVAAGGRRVRMLPYFLSAGAHVAHDLEAHRRDLVARFPEVEFVLCRPLGAHPLILEIVLDRLREADSGASGR